MTGAAATRVLLADDQDLIRAGLRMIVNSAPDLTVVGEAATDREREIVALVATGMSNAEIAGHLTLSPLTVKTHANHAMTKLGARDRAQLVVLAYQAGLAGTQNHAAARPNPAPPHSP
jgi:DNA-binding NarL/FixJ family response regulator